MIFSTFSSNLSENINKISSNKSQKFPLSILNAPRQRFRVPKKFPSRLDLNEHAKRGESQKKESFPFELASNCDFIEKTIIPLESRNSSDSVSTTDDDNSKYLLTEEKDGLDISNGVVSILNIITRKVRNEFDN